MELLRLEIKGFKSFADKTIVNFSSGMTAIVGPNGSGKSNITDAIRWVLGESNVRHLRGQKAEDIIFSGTESRRAHNAAEVTLVFDNRDHKLGDDYAEVAITRRIYRSGDSEFFINKRACRLKDIHFLLADTGLGKDSMAIIGQNRVDAILNSKPEDRRQIFEDVAGIGRFKLNKEEALRKISQTERNMERLDDVMGTLESHLLELEKKAETTRAYEGLAKKKRIYDGALAYHEYKTADRLFTKQENEKLQYDQELEDLEESQGTVVSTIKESQSTVDTLRENLRGLDDRYALHQGDFGRMEGQIALWNEKERRLKEDAETLGKQVQALGQAKALTESILAELRASMVVAQEENERCQQAVEKAKSNYDDMLKQLDAKKGLLDQLLSKKTHEEEERKRIEAHIFRLEHTIELWHEREETRREEERQGRDQYETLLASHREVSQVLQTLRGELESKRAEGDSLRERLGELRISMKAGEESLHGLTRELQAKLGRKEALEAQELDLVGYAEGTRHVLQSKESWRKGIHGAVADLFQVEGRFVKAIETALGASIHHVVTDTAKTASAAIAYLRQQRGGKATFLPSETIGGKIQSHEVLQEMGVLGLGCHCITFHKDYEQVFRYLLGRTIIVESLSIGIALQKKYQQSLRIVTLEGDQLQPGGALTGGAFKKKGPLVLERKEELLRLGAATKVLEQNILKEEQRLESLQGEVANLEDRYTQYERVYEEKREDLLQRENDWKSLEMSLETLRTKIAHWESTAQQWSEELRQVNQELEEAKDELATTKESYDAGPLERLEKEIHTLMEEERAIYDRWRTLMLEQQQQQMHLQNKEEKCRSLEETLRKHSEELEDGEMRILQLHADIEMLPEEKCRLDEQWSALETALTTVQDEREKAKEMLREEERRLTSCRDEQQTMTQRMQQVQQRLTNIQENLVKYKINEEYALQRLEELGFTREEGRHISLEGGVQDWKTQQGALQESIEALGPINPQAIVEYEEALERKAFYEGQREDLSKGKEQLLQVVEEVDQVMCTQLEEVYDRVGEEFQRIFSSLFGGGIAQIVVTHPDDLLQGGVEFYIQPPGKKRQQLTLLSGGERALTVIALLFAFLAYRPSPVCVLDEVDAALDEANVERFSSYLQQLGKETQFIVVSHRKRTMESAHVLQGVTMVERGVSKLLTVTFDDLREDVEYGI